MGEITASSAPSGGSSDDLASLAKQFMTAPPGGGAYKIGALDVLDITVFKVPELTRAVQVADNGRISFPLIGEMVAAGKTPQEVERQLAQNLGARYLQSPQVSVFVKEYNSQRFTVDGAVKKPGVYPLKGRSTLLQAIASAEGLDRETADSVVVVFRQTSAGRSAARFDLDEIRAGKAEDPAIIQGDTVVVGTSGGKVAFSYLIKALPAASLFRLL